MQTNVMFLDCPAYMDDHGAVRCGLPAAVEYWYTLESSDGPLESAKIRCPRGHGFNGPAESLTWESGRSNQALRDHIHRSSSPATGFRHVRRGV